MVGHSEHDCSARHETLHPHTVSVGSFDTITSVVAVIMRRRGRAERAEGGLRRQIATVHLVIVVTGVVTTAALVFNAELQSALFAPQVRPVIEVAGACIVLFAALILAIPTDDDVRPARNAFAAALVVLGASNCVFGLLPAFERSAFVGELAFYPWIAARYVVGAFFVLAGLERPRASLGSYLLLGLAVLAVVELPVVWLSGTLAAPLHVSMVAGQPAVVVSWPVVHVGLQAPPMALFVVGAWLAARLYLRGGSPEFAWLSAALAVQAIAQVHEMLFPAFLGPILRSPDVLRFVSFALLSGAAVVQMLYLYRERSRIIWRQGRELRTQQAINDQLRAFAEQEADFRAVVTHELATPIATIRTFGHVARRRARGHDNAELQRVLEGITSEAERLQQLVARMDELRSLEMAESTCDLRPVLIQRLLEEASHFVQGLPGDHGVSFAAEEARVLADPMRLGQALRNVLVNSARYSPHGTNIAIAGECAGSGRYRITIDDAGPGIPADERHKVLRRYARGSAATKSRGQGLGLYLASSIIEAHGGAIRLEDSPLGGTRAVIDLRLASVPRAG
jgi:signal transduction histidine kinase